MTSFVAESVRGVPSCAMYSTPVAFISPSTKILVTLEKQRISRFGSARTSGVRKARAEETRSL
eukprot:389849-Pleurochrysis_carterae.AAC.1